MMQGGAGSNQGVQAVSKNEMGFDRNKSGRGSNDGSVFERVWVMDSIYIGCRQSNISFSLFFLSLPFL